MKEKVQPYIDKTKEFVGKIPKRVLILIGVGVAVLVAGIIIMMILSQNKPYAVLFTNLSTEESSSVVSMLDSYGVPYRLEQNGTVMVPKEQENSLKARFAMEGYPKTGYSYSTYFDHVGALSTESERSRAYIMDLQDRIGAVIRNFDGVRDATVNITVGEDRTYVLDSGNVINASAGISVDMYDGKTLTVEQATAIRNFVAHSVQGLSIDDVSIVDNLGNQYDALSQSVNGDASALKLQLKQQMENSIRTKVMGVLLPIYEEGNVRAEVYCDIEVADRDIEEYIPELPEWANDGSTNGAGIIGSREYGYVWSRDGDETVGGVVGEPANADLPTNVEREPGVQDATTKVSGEGKIIYDNKKTNIKIKTVAFNVLDCNVAVTINSNVVTGVNAQQLREHVAMVAGINAVVTEDMTAAEYIATKVSVLEAPFPGMENDNNNQGGNGITIQPWMLIAAAIGLALFLILLIILLILSARRRKKREEEERAAEEERLRQEAEAAAALEGLANADLGSADVMEMQTDKSMELRQDIRQFADENPEIAAQLVRNWLRGGDEDA